MRLDAILREARSSVHRYPVTSVLLALAVWEEKKREGDPPPLPLLIVAFCLPGYPFSPLHQSPFGCERPLRRDGEDVPHTFGILADFFGHFNTR